MATVSLFERLGGSSGIRTLVDDVVTAHTENPTISARFLPYLATPDRLAVIKKHTCNFFEMGSGGPAAYTGRSMGDAHRGMNVSETEYVAAMDDILGVLKKRGMSDDTQKDVLAILYSLKGEIVHV
jgi:hemoglobin